MTAMRTGIYAILAVVVGVMLVGLLPGQLSNFAAPTVVQTANLQSGGAPESTLNKTSTAGNTVITGRGYSNSTISVVPTTPANSSGFIIATLNDTAASTASQAASAARSLADAATSAATAAGTKKNDTIFGMGPSVSFDENTYMDLGYYALWGVGLIAALAVYFVSKRILG